MKHIYDLRPVHLNLDRTSVQYTQMSNMYYVFPDKNVLSLLCYLIFLQLRSWKNYTYAKSINNGMITAGEAM